VTMVDRLAPPSGSLGSTLVPLFPPCFPTNAQQGPLHRADSVHRKAWFSNARNSSPGNGGHCDLTGLYETQFRPPGMLAGAGSAKRTEVQCVRLRRVQASSSAPAARSTRTLNRRLRGGTLSTKKTVVPGRAIGTRVIHPGITSCGPPARFPAFRCA